MERNKEQKWNIGIEHKEGTQNERKTPFHDSEVVNTVWNRRSELNPTSGEGSTMEKEIEGQDNRTMNDQKPNTMITNQ